MYADWCLRSDPGGVPFFFVFFFLPDSRLQANNTADAPGCQLECARSSGCSIFAWSSVSKACWFRLDGLWGAPGTLRTEPGRVRQLRHHFDSSFCLIIMEQRRGGVM